MNATRLFAITAALCLNMTALAQDGAEDSGIAPQPLNEALQEFADKSGLQIIYVAELAKGKVTGGAKANLSDTETLDQLLASTGLEYEFLNANTVAVHAAADKERSSHSGNAPTTPGMVMTAQASVAKSRKTEEEEDRESQQLGVRGRQGIPFEELEEIVVTGSNIRGVGDVGTASITFTRDELDNAGYSTVEELFESLPQNLDEISHEGASADGTSQIAGSNSQGASGISLRGLGPGSTLVLINGKRRPGNLAGRVVDISAIPLSMVERIELVTGGRSAVYGSDAVAGVVNIVTRTEFDGAETQLWYGEASEGWERVNFNQTFGRTFDRGGFVLGYDYRKDRVLDATDTGLVQAPSRTNSTPIPGLFPVRNPSEQHAGLFSGHVELSEEVELYADAQFSAGRNEAGQAFRFILSGFGDFDVGGTAITDSDQYSAVGGVRLDVGKHWQIDVSGLYGMVDNSAELATLFAPGGTTTSLDIPATSREEDEAELTSLSAIADGPLGQFAGETVSAAIGMDFRNESYERVVADLTNGMVTPRENLDRDIWSIFGEIHLPLIKRDEQRLEVSLAGRHDDYSDFGSTFNPQIAIEWEPTGGLILRGSYSEAFRAPDLFTLAFSTQAFVQIVDEPMAPGTAATLFSVTGGNRGLQPEEADTYTIGIDSQLSDHTKLSLSYFNIQYEGRIDQPVDDEGGTALQDEALLPGLINRNPTPEQLNDLLDRVTLFRNLSGVPFDPAIDDPFTTFTNIVIFDNRRNNIGLEEVDGIDFQASAVLKTGSGDWSFDLNGTYYIDFTRNITVTAPPIEQLNQPGKPVDLKLRGRVGWSRNAWNVNAYVNYVDSYIDTIAATPTTISSWTTVDLTIRYDFARWADSEPLNDFQVTLGVKNVLDRDPPIFLSNSVGLGYDGANANPVGRFLSLQLSKHW